MEKFSQIGVNLTGEMEKLKEIERDRNRRKKTNRYTGEVVSYLIFGYKLITKQPSRR